MSSKQKGKSQASRKVTTEDLNSLLRNLIATIVLLEQFGGKSDLTGQGKWELWRICRRLADQANSRLAALFAAPTFATIPILDDLILKTEVALKSGSLTAEQRKEVDSLADQLDFALALIYRQLGHLILWRGQHTRHADLFCEALNIARGNSSREAHMIRGCIDRFPEELVPGADNIVDMFAWETYRRVEELDRLADEFPAQIASAARQMHGWPMLRQRHHNNHARFEILIERFDLGAEYPLETSKQARFRPDSPMVRLLDPLVYKLYHIYRATRNERYQSIGAENYTLRNLWWEPTEDSPDEKLLAVLRNIRRLPPLSKATAKEWVKKGIVPLILITHVKDYQNCTEPALMAISRQKGVKSMATFKSRLLAAAIPTLRSMARTD